LLPLRLPLGCHIQPLFLGRPAHGTFKEAPQVKEEGEQMELGM
jgi:hypothetical protein